MKELDLVGVQAAAGMPRRTFLRNSLLAGVPLLAAGLGLPKAAFASSGYVPPTRLRGTAVRSVKDYGAVGDGVHDDTSAFQAAVNALPADGGTVVVPAGNYLIDPVRRVTLRSKMHLKLDPSAVLTAKPNSADRAYVLMVYRISDVEISGGRIVGDRDKHLGTTGEWGHGIQVRGASRVTIRDIHVSRCWGDGICIGGAEIPNQPTIYSYDVAIANVVCTGNRRQALTIGRSTVIRVYDSELSYAGGIAPGCGIDIEPDPDKSTTKLTADITINNCWIHHNQQNGVMIYKQVNRVTIKNCKIEYNGGYGVLAITAKGGYLAGNNISHNYLEGVMIRVASDTYTFAGNTCRNNKTRLWGIVTTGTLVKLVGLVTGTGAHIQVTTDCTNVKVTTNYYAK